MSTPTTTPAQITFEPSHETEMAGNSSSDPAENPHLLWAVTLILVVLGLGLFLISSLRRHQVLLLPETTALLLIGVIIGLILRFAGTENSSGLGEVLRFNGPLFFLVLIPTIVYEGAYDFKVRDTV